MGALRAAAVRPISNPMAAAGGVGPGIGVRLCAIHAALDAVLEIDSRGTRRSAGFKFPRHKSDDQRS